MDCYTAPVKACLTQFNALNKRTAAALAALPDTNVAAGMAKLLVDGSQFKDTWTLTTVNDDVHISAYTFQAIGFLENYQVRTPSQEGTPRREGTRRRTTCLSPVSPYNILANHTEHL